MIYQYDRIEDNGFVLKISNTPIRKKSGLTEYVELNDRNWKKDIREQWKIKSDESRKNILAKYGTVAVHNEPESIKHKKTYKVPEGQQFSL